MKKVLIVVTKAEMGGAQTFALNLARGLKQNNTNLIVGFGEGEFLKAELEKSKIPCMIFQTLKRTKNPLLNLKFIFEIKKFIENEKIDVVHFNSSNSLFGAVGAKLAKSKPRTIFTFHGLSVLDPNYQTNLVFKLCYRLIFKFLLKFIDQAVFVSQTNLEYAQKNQIAKNGVVIYNGLDLNDSNFLTKEEARNFLEVGLLEPLRSDFLIGSIGRLAYPKNYEFLINAFPDILKIKPNAVCIIIGEGPERNKYETLIKELKLGDRVFLLGEINDAYKYLKAFDLFVLPSIYEGLSMSLIETLFAQIPALASNVGGNAEILGEENLYSLNDKVDFIEKFKNISAHAKNENKLEKFSLDQMVNRHLKIYG